MASIGRSWTEREFDAFLDSRGGIVSRAELLGAGWTADDLRLARGLYGRPQRLRRGWYCSRELPAIIRQAWAHGGPLACVSALRWYGEIAALDSRVGDNALHICVPRHTRGRSVEAHDPLPTVVHWDDAAQDPLARWAVPREVAWAQALHCHGRPHAHDSTSASRGQAALVEGTSGASRGRSSPSRRAARP